MEEVGNEDRGNTGCNTKAGEVVVVRCISPCTETSVIWTREGRNDPKTERRRDVVRGKDNHECAEAHRWIFFSDESHDYLELNFCSEWVRSTDLQDTPGDHGGTGLLAP